MYTGRDISGADLSGRNLSKFSFRLARAVDANFAGSSLRGADFAYADLRGADFGNADLSGASLRHSDLRGACFVGAKVTQVVFDGALTSGVNGLAPERFNHLMILMDQVGPIRAYRLIGGPQRIGNAVTVGTLAWCLKHRPPGGVILLVEIDRADILDIGDGDILVRQCRDIEERLI